MKTSERGIKLIKDFEGFRRRPYLCSAGVATIGYGSTRYSNGVKVKISDQPITEEEADKLLTFYLAKNEVAIEHLIGKPLNQNQFDAVMSFVYNLGLGNFEKSSMLKRMRVNPNDIRIDYEFSKWVYVGGRRNAGLIRRRTEEANIYFSRI